MSTLVPKGVKEESWKKLTPLRDYAVLCPTDSSVFFKFGQGRGYYISIDPAGPGRIVNETNYENGDPSLLGNLPPDSKCILGRMAEATIKVMHAMISRQHVEFKLQGNVLVVRDLGSTNGTYIHDEIPHFDIADHLEHHAPGTSGGETLNWIHDVFGVHIDEFLQSYSQQKKESN